MVAILFALLLFINFIRWLMRKPVIWSDTPNPGSGYIGWHEVNNKEIPY